MVWELKGEKPQHTSKAHPLKGEDMRRRTQADGEPSDPGTTQWAANVDNMKAWKRSRSRFVFPMF